MDYELVLNPSDFDLFDDQFAISETPPQIANSTPTWPATQSPRPCPSAPHRPLVPIHPCNLVAPVFTLTPFFLLPGQQDASSSLTRACTEMPLILSFPVTFSRHVPPWHANCAEPPPIQLPNVLSLPCCPVATTPRSTCTFLPSFQCFPGSDLSRHLIQSFPIQPTPIPQEVDNTERPVLYQGDRMVSSNYNELGCNVSSCRFHHFCSFCLLVHFKFYTLVPMYQTSDSLSAWTSTLPFSSLCPPPHPFFTTSLWTTLAKWKCVCDKASNHLGTELPNLKTSRRFASDWPPELFSRSSSSAIYEPYPIVIVALLASSCT